MKSRRAYEARMELWRRNVIAASYEPALYALAVRGHYRSRRSGEAFVIALAAYMLGARRVRLEFHGGRYHVHLTRGRKKLLKSMGRLWKSGQLREVLYQAHQHYVRWRRELVWKGVKLGDYFKQLKAELAENPPLLY